MGSVWLFSRIYVFISVYLFAKGVIPFLSAALESRWHALLFLLSHGNKSGWSGTARFWLTNAIVCMCAFLSSQLESHLEISDRTS